MPPRQLGDIPIVGPDKSELTQPPALGRDGANDGHHPHGPRRNAIDKDQRQVSGKGAAAALDAPGPTSGHVRGFRLPSKSRFHHALPRPVGFMAGRETSRDAYLSASLFGGGDVELAEGSGCGLCGRPRWRKRRCDVPAAPLGPASTRRFDAAARRVVAQLLSHQQAQPDSSLTLYPTVDGLRHQHCTN